MLCIRDLGSTNGTFVNGKRITSDTLLAEGDWLEIGDVHLKVDCKGTTPLSRPERHNFQKTCYFNGQEALESARGLIELLDGHKLEPCFQPIHNLGDRDIHGYEYLARSEVASVSNPGQMFAAAEAAGRQVELSMLCRQMAVEHSICLPARLPLFLNTHPEEPLLRKVVPQLQELRTLQPARPLVLEIHEGAITEPELVRNLRAALKEIGVQLAFDDFGAGQARIRELICAPSDYIKFDAALIRDLQNVSDDQFGMFRSIISAVKAEGALTVAEGIETEEMIATCRELGFDLLQGFALSRPAIMHPMLPRPFKTPETERLPDRTEQ